MADTDSPADTFLMPQNSAATAALVNSHGRYIGKAVDTVRTPLFDNLMQSGANAKAEMTKGQPNYTAMAANLAGVGVSLVGAGVMSEVERHATNLITDTLLHQRDPYTNLPDVKSVHAALMQRAVDNANPTFGYSQCFDAAETLRINGVTGGVCAGIGVGTTGGIHNPKAGVVAQLRF